MNLVHLIPSPGNHDTAGLDCACNPTFHKTCPECEPRVVGDDTPSCWYCEKGMVKVDRYDAEDLATHGVSVMIVHNAPHDQAKGAE